MAEKNFWFKFLIADWLRDTHLRRCSKTAKGVWIDMICLLHQCEEIGVFQTSGVPWPDRDIAVAVGGDIAENLRALEELLANGVCSRNNAGAIFCRKMVRDVAKSKACSDAGKRGGGNPAFKKRKGDPKGVPKHSSNSNSDSDSESDSEKESGHVSGAPPGCAEVEAFPIPPPRAGRLTFDRRMLPIPAVLNTPEFVKAWNRWLDHRVQKGTVTTEDEAKGWLSAFRRYGPDGSVDIITRTIEVRGWQTLDFPKENSTNGRGQRAANAYTADGHQNSGDVPI